LKKNGPKSGATKAVAAGVPPAVNLAIAAHAPTAVANHAAIAVQATDPEIADATSDPGGRPGDQRRGEGPPEIDIDKLIADSLYLDNQAHVVVSRMRDMDSGTKSQLRRLYNAVRRATRAPESERQHEFVMVRARLAYTIARHSLRSLDALERLLLQVTRKNDIRGYERFRDLFEAIIAYNE
jgi:CRISPR type III-A-associated protein Csm2